MLKYIGDQSLTAYRFFPFLVKEKSLIHGVSSTHDPMPIDAYAECLRNASSVLHTNLTLEVYIKEPQLDELNALISQDVTLGIHVLVENDNIFRHFHSCNKLCIRSREKELGK